MNPKISALPGSPRSFPSSGYVEQHHEEQHVDQTLVPHLITTHSDRDDDDRQTIRYIELKYDVDPRIIGVGVHGSVRICTDRVTGARRAVKSICKHDPAIKPGRLEREIDLLSEMDHPNIVRLEDIYEDGDHVHLVTELCEGGELFDRIVEMSSTNNGVPCFVEEDASRIVRQVLSSVSFMHGRGIVHRDIKPENILFSASDPDSSVKVVDFGLSRRHLCYRDPQMRTVVGTPYYIAPEVLKRRYDRMCDLWSVGVIAYVLLCGYPPFNGDDTVGVHRAVLRGRYKFLAEDWGSISGDAMDFIRRLLHNDPRRRMTAGQALNHPWITRYKGHNSTEGKGDAVERETPKEEEEEGGVRDKSSVEVLYKESKKELAKARSSGTPTSPSPGRRIRASMFAI